MPLGSLLATPVSGLGERAENADIEEVAAFLVKKSGVSRYNLKHLPKLSRYVARAAHISFSPRKPVVGDEIFTCESEIHIDGLIKNSSNYEPFDPAEVSLKRKIIIGKKAGKNALRQKLSSLGLRVEENHLTELLTKIRKESFRLKMGFTDNELLHFCNSKK